MYLKVSGSFVVQITLTKHFFLSLVKPLEKQRKTIVHQSIAAYNDPAQLEKHVKNSLGRMTMFYVHIFLGAYILVDK